MMILRNMRRRTFYWPVMGRLEAVAPGEVFAIHEGELAADATLRCMLDRYISNGLLTVEASGVGVPPWMLH